MFEIDNLFKGFKIAQYFKFICLDFAQFLFSQ